MRAYEFHDLQKNGDGSRVSKNGGGEDLGDYRLDDGDNG